MEWAGQKGRRGLENDEDDEFVLMEHHLRREELERDDFEQEL